MISHLRIHKYIIEYISLNSIYINMIQDSYIIEINRTKLIELI